MAFRHQAVVDSIPVVASEEKGDRSVAEEEEETLVEQHSGEGVFAGQTAQCKESMRSSEQQQQHN